MQQVYKTTKILPKQLADVSEIPEDFVYLWQWYTELAGTTPLSYTEISNWSTITRRDIQAWEVDVLKALDRVYWRVLNE